MKTINPEQFKLAEEAALWLLRMNEDSSAATREVFSQWIRESHATWRRFCALTEPGRPECHGNEHRDTGEYHQFALPDLTLRQLRFAHKQGHIHAHVI